MINKSRILIFMSNDIVWYIYNVKVVTKIYDFQFIDIFYDVEYD